MIRKYLAALALLALAQATHADSFTIYGVPEHEGKTVFSWPWASHMASYSVPAQLGAESSTGTPATFSITRVFCWRDGATIRDSMMLGKLDVDGDGGDYLTPGQTYGDMPNDSGWFPADTRPLFAGRDELHVHVTGSAIVYCTIYFIR